MEMDEMEQEMAEHDIKESEEEREGGEPEEGQAAKPLTQPHAPTRRQVEEHELTHLPYRSWCLHCRRSRGVSMAHRKTDEEKEEEKERAMTTFAIDYTFLTEDFELLTREQADKLEDKTKIKDTVMVADDRKTGGAKAHLVECKGNGDTWIARRLAEDLVEFGYAAVDVCIKSDQEPAILEVQARVGELRKGGRTVPINSPVGDSKSNGRVENTIRRVQGMVRTLRSSLESKLGIKIAKGHPLYPWLLEWAADVLTRYSVNSAGRTAVQEIRGSKSARAIAHFGEKVMYMPAQTASGKLGKLDPRYYDGIFLGMRLRSDEIIIGTENGVVKARSVRRYPDGQQWDKELARRIRGTPRQPVPGVESDKVPATLGRMRETEDVYEGELRVEGRCRREAGEHCTDQGR